MKNYKKELILVISIFIYMLLWSRLNEFHSITDIYNGVFFQGRPYFYICYFLNFFIYVFYFFRFSEEYISEHGIYVVTRTKSRKILYIKLRNQILKKICQIEFLRIAAGILTVLMIHQRFPAIKINEFFYFFLANFFCMTLFITIQMLLECFFSETTAILSVIAGFFSLCTIGGSSIVQPNYKLNFLFFPNLMMKHRIDSVDGFGFTQQIFAIIFLGFIIFTIYHIGKSFFLKKDFI